MNFKLKSIIISFCVFIQCIPLSHQSIGDFLTGIADTVINGVTTIFEPALTEAEISRDGRRVGFLLYPSKEEIDYYVSIDLGDYEGLNQSGYNVSLPLIVITHGFFSQTKNPVVEIIKKAYRQEDYEVNIIETDWSALSTADSELSVAFYGTAAHNVQVVGKRLADFLIFLEKGKVLKGPEDVHLIGHSLGAHVSGMAGMFYQRSTKKLINRISGLDPAGPVFITESEDKRLDATDAFFVDITHTNRGMLGFDGDLGHVDFYPNGGGPSQPGCNDITGTCSHSNSYIYWAYGLKRIISACRCNVREDDVEKCIRFCKDPIIYGERCQFNARGEYYFQIDLKKDIFL